MNLTYSTSRSITEAEFVDLLNRTTLGARRPVNDPKIIAAMLRHADLLSTAWSDDKLVGVARSVTDFEYCCYLSDLAVDEAYQNRGIGKELIAQTKSRLGSKAFIILLAAPAAREYYPKIGFDPHPSAWLLPAEKALK
jgi:predicted N-acetyltransferase YhbS